MKGVRDRGWQPEMAATGTRGSHTRLLTETRGLYPQHLLETVDSEGHVIGKTLVIEEKVGAAFRKVIVEFLGHTGDETCDGVFDVIFLPVHIGVEIDPQLLMQETIGRFDTFFGDHGYEGVNHNLAAKIANSFHLAKLLGDNLYLCTTFFGGLGFFCYFCSQKQET